MNSKEILRLVRKCSISKDCYLEIASTFAETYEFSIANMIDKTNIFDELINIEDLDGINYIEKSYFFRNNKEMPENIIDLINEKIITHDNFEIILNKFFIITSKLVKTFIETNFFDNLNDNGKLFLFGYLLSNGYFESLNSWQYSNMPDRNILVINKFDRHFWNLPYNTMTYLLTNTYHISNENNYEFDDLEHVIKMMERHCTTKEKKLLCRIIWFSCSANIIKELLNRKSIDPISLKYVSHNIFYSNDSVNTWLKIIGILLTIDNVRERVFSLAIEIIQAMSDIDHYALRNNEEIYKNHSICLEFIFRNMSQDEFNKLDVKKLEEMIYRLCECSYMTSEKVIICVQNILMTIKNKINNNGKYDFCLELGDGNYPKNNFILLCNVGIKNIRLKDDERILESCDDVLKYLIYDIKDRELAFVYLKYIME